jgi:hypothetical protein
MRSGSVDHQTILQLNIERCRRLLEVERNPAKRETIATLLHEAVGTETWRLSGSNAHSSCSPLSASCCRPLVKPKPCLIRSSARCSFSWCSCLLYCLHAGSCESLPGTRQFPADKECLGQQVRSAINVVRSAPRPGLSASEQYRPISRDPQFAPDAAGAGICRAAYRRGGSRSSITFSNCYTFSRPKRPWRRRPFDSEPFDAQEHSQCLTRPTG